MSEVHTFRISDANDINRIDYDALKKEGLEVFQVGDDFITFDSENTLSKGDQKRILKNPAWHGVIRNSEWNQREAKKLRGNLPLMIYVRWVIKCCKSRRRTFYQETCIC